MSKKWHFSYFWRNFWVLENIRLPISMKMGPNVKLSLTYHIRQENARFYHFVSNYFTKITKKPENLILFEILAQNTILENDYGYGQFRVFYVDLCPFISKCNRFLLICCRILFIFCCFSFIFWLGFSVVSQSLLDIVEYRWLFVLVDF